MTSDKRLDDGGGSALERALECLSEARERLADAERALGQVQAKGATQEQRPAPQTGEAPADSWRERLWRAPSECRIGLPELCEAVGKSEGWVYARTRESAADRIPHAKIGGALSFRCGEIRNWIRQMESVEVAGPSDPPEGTVQIHDRRTA